MKSTFLHSNRLWAVLALSMSLAVFSSCKKDPPPPPPPDDFPQTCTVHGTLTSVACGTGVFGNYWIKLDNGKLLQPCSSSLPTSAMIVYEGKRIKFGYKPSIAPDACDSVITCKVWQPPHDRVRLTCLQEMPEEPVTCNRNGTVLHDELKNQACHPFLIRDDDGTLYEPLNQEPMKQYKNNDRIRYSAREVYTLVATCSGATPAEVTCIEHSDLPPVLFCKPIKPEFITNQVPRGPSVQDAWIEGNCLKVKVGFSGCSSDISRFDLMWNNMITNGVVNLRVNDGLGDGITCEAYFIATLSFDLSTIKTRCPSQVTIYLAGWNKPLYLNGMVK